ncbi:hypothetical protein PLICRDRAFT_169249 [Plicaturopsis crispa FD-325 SS-3]|nr:hypothetical protein PLICRDRAFT_169249 [Plicaturopsis crispa FD-325 SS-3]
MSAATALAEQGSSSAPMPVIQPADRPSIFAEMRVNGLWVDGGHEFLEQFANKSAVNDCIRRACPQTPDRAIAHFLQTYPGYSMEDKRWTNIPPRAAIHDDLYGPTDKLINDILTHFQLSDLRRSEDTHDLHFPPVIDGEGHLKTSPDHMILGVGRSISPFPTLPPAGPHATYAQCVSVIDHARDVDCTGAIDGPLSCAGARQHWIRLNRLALYARELLRPSNARRFAYGALMTETRVTLAMCDRAGGMVAPAVNFHEQPATFVRIVLALCLDDERELGYDTDVFWEDGQRCIRTVSPVDGGKRAMYRLQNHGQPLSPREAPCILGRGAAVWKGWLDGVLYIIKDSWFAPYERAEWQTLSVLAGLDGVGQMLGSDCDPDFTISRQRPGNDVDVLSPFFECSHPKGCGSVCNVIQDYAFSRVVLEQYGPRLEEFDSVLQLMCAFYDAVEGHRNMFRKGILHGDISPGNVLLGSTDLTKVGQRGRLIDMDLALSLEEAQAVSKTSIAGTPGFESLLTLQGGWTPDHSDDLESFFWLLAWILNRLSAPHTPRRPRPPFLAGWDHDSRRVSLAAKLRFLRPRKLAPCGFGPVVQELLQGLRDFAWARYARKVKVQGTSVQEEYDVVRLGQGEEFLGTTAEEDYEEFLGIVRAAIRKQARVESRGDVEAATPAPAPRVKRRAPESDDEGDSAPPKKRGPRVRRRAA